RPAREVRREPGRGGARRGQDQLAPAERGQVGDEMNLRDHLAAQFRDLPIRRKLRILFILTTVIALLLAGVGIVGADSFMFYTYLRRDLATFVRVIGDNSTAALAFEDSKAAAETLNALRSRSHVEIACLYQTSGAVLATYSRPGF